MKWWRRASCVFLTLVLTGGTLFVRADVFRQASEGFEQTIQPYYFGMHIHELNLPKLGVQGRTDWPAARIGQLRLWDSGLAWLDMNRQPGQWDFSRMDAYVDQAWRQGAGILYPLALTPTWASVRPEEPCPYGKGCGAEPRSMDLWRDYVRTVVARYGSRIHAYELWNEPTFSDFEIDRKYPGFYTGSVSVMVDMARVAREILDELQPGAVMCTPGFVNGPHRLDLFLKAGGARYVQAICYHFYSESTAGMALSLIHI